MKQVKSEKEAFRKLNYLLFLFTFIAGIVWWGIGEVFFSFAKGSFEDIIENPLLNGAYFAFLAILTIAACLLSERVFHSIVEKDFFDEAVMTPSLKKIFPAAFIIMLLAAGALQFIYQFEYTPNTEERNNPGRQTAQIPVQGIIPIDYYFLLDNTTSLQKNDPDFERIKLLEKIIDNISGDRKIALISFADKATVHIRPTFASDGIKNQFKETINGLKMIDETSQKNALLNASSILTNDVSRKEVVIFITDGEDNKGWGEYSPDFNQVMAPFIAGNVSIHGIFLNLNNTESSFLKTVSRLTGGIYSTVKDPVDLESYVTEIIETEEESVVNPSVVRPGVLPVQEPLRDLLNKRYGNRQNSVLYALLHIAIMAIIGTFMGYLLYMVFSNRRVFLPLFIGGGISGLLAGLVLELLLQMGIWPDSLARLLSCVILSVIIWPVYYMVRSKSARALSSSIGVSGETYGSSDYLLANQNKSRESTEGIFRSEKKEPQQRSGILGVHKEGKKE